jgi:hypothetical protein
MGFLAAGRGNGGILPRTEQLPIRRRVEFRLIARAAASAQGHHCAGRVELARHAGLADLACIRPGVNDPYRDGSREPSVRRAARLPGTGCVHLHGPIGERCRRNGGAAGLDEPACGSGLPKRGIHEAGRCGP